MTPHALIDAARAAGLSLSVDGDWLIVEADRRPPPDLLAALRAYKPDLLALLTDPPPALRCSPPPKVLTSEKVSILGASEQICGGNAGTSAKMLTSGRVSILGESEHLRREASDPPAGPDPVDADWSDAADERAAIVEYDAGVPRAWAEGFARLDPDHPPPYVTPWRWRQFVDDVGRFLDGGFAPRAAALGWSPYDLFGCDRDRPVARVDRAGLLWLLRGNRLVMLSADHAVVETRSGARQTFRRRRPAEPGRVLAWDLVDGGPE